MQSVRVSVKDAAKEIGCAPEYLRRQMRSGRWSGLGEVIKPGKGMVHYEYFIFRSKLDKFLGKNEKSSTDSLDADSATKS